MTSKDGRAIARENEVRILRALHRTGWLRTRDLAALRQRWSSKPPVDGPGLRPVAPTVSSLRMAQRTLRRMRDKRLVLQARAPDGSLIYSLAEGGARALQLIGVKAESGKDLMRSFSSAHFRHRCISNEVAVSALVEGFRVATEREVAKGLWLGGDAGIAGKRPDVLVRNGSSIWWVEVQRSRMNAKDYPRLLRWLGAVGRDALQPQGSKLLGETMRWARLVFICRPAFQAQVCRDLEAAGWSKAKIDSLILFETSLYKFEDINFS